MYKDIKKVEVLHAALECDAKVGGVGMVTLGLPPALSRKGYNVSIVTPAFDVYFSKHFKDKKIEEVTTVNHIFKGQLVRSKILRARKEVDGENNTPVYHYLVKPEPGSAAEFIFDIKDDKNIYQTFILPNPRNGITYSHAGLRLEYFNGAIAAMLRMPNYKIPTFDIYHSHTWHTGLAGVLAKEFENLPKWRSLPRNNKKPLKKIPYMVSTIHMLLEREHGQLHNAQQVSSFIESVGLPEDFANKFPTWKAYINKDSLKQVVLALLYSDAVNTVSEGLAYEVSQIKGGGKGLDDLFQWLHKNGRLQGILNGIDHRNYDASNPKLLGEYAVSPDSPTEHKNRIKQILAKKYPKLDPNAMWFGFVGRFAKEKGIERLEAAAEEIAQQKGMLIIMGSHVVFNKKNGVNVPFFGELIDRLKTMPHVVVIDDLEEQKKDGALVRAAINCTLVTSDEEACGLPQMENFAGGAYAVAPRTQGIPDSVKDIRITPETGTGFLYHNDPDLEVRTRNLCATIRVAAEFYKQELNAKTLDATTKRIMLASKKLDWNATPSIRYANFYTRILHRSLLTFDRIRTVYKPMLHQFRYQPALNLFHSINKRRTADARRAKAIPVRTPAKPGKAIPTKIHKPKVFQIGFNKSGTQMLYYALLESGISCIHYGTKGKSLARSIFENDKNGRPLLEGIDGYQAYFDMEDPYHKPPLFAALDYFKKLDEQYPGSKFILNTRDKNDWINSRLTHKDPITQVPYVSALCKNYNCDVDTLVARWSKEWDEHHKSVREHFKNRPQDLLEYNIDRDPPQKIIEFFSDLNINPKVFKVVNKTPDHQKDEIRTNLVLPRPIRGF